MLWLYNQISESEEYIIMSDDSDSVFICAQKCIICEKRKKILKKRKKPISPIPSLSLIADSNVGSLDKQLKWK